MHRNIVCDDDRVCRPTWDAADDESSTQSQTRVGKKLKLFGFELDPYRNSNSNSNSNRNRSSETQTSTEKGDESVNSSSTSEREKVDVTKRSSGEEERKKLECQYCLKEFANSQALGGHQNAHKKERMKKKRLQLQANKASISYYLEPYQNTHGFNFHAYGSTTTTSPLLYGPSHSTYASEFTIYDDSHISFSPFDHYQDNPPVPLQHMFTLTHEAAAADHHSRSRENTASYH